MAKEARRPPPVRYVRNPSNPKAILCVDTRVEYGVVQLLVRHKAPACSSLGLGLMKGFCEEHRVQLAVGRNSLKHPGQLPNRLPAKVEKVLERQQALVFPASIVILYCHWQYSLQMRLVCFLQHTFDYRVLPPMRVGSDRPLVSGCGSPVLVQASVSTQPPNDNRGSSPVAVCDRPEALEREVRKVIKDFLIAK